jgi:serine/threonine protein kinase
VTSAAPPSPDHPGARGVPARGPSPADNPRRLAGRYRLDSVIGKGSMGTVWSATDEVLHRQVAIKEIDFPVGIPAAERAQLEHRTLREARAIAALSNPFVITLFDILTLNNGPVIVMELLRARSLAEILRKVGRLPDGQAATVGVAVASGLLAAHAAGITHRDVKPGNVLICDDGRIKLTDFGIARSSGDQTMTATGLLLGSPAYIAPEVASGVPAGPVSDAWSLGGLLFASVEGRPPFDQGTAIATLTSVVKDPVPPHPHSGRLGAVVSGLLVKTPSLRMRVDRALTIMRGIADDPSGTNLAVVAKIPRDGSPVPRTPGAPTGSAVSGSAVSGRPFQASDSRSPLHSTPQPPATSPADASTHPPGTPAVGPFGPGQGPPPGPSVGQSTGRSTGPGGQPGQPQPWTGPPPRTGGTPGFAPLGLAPGHPQDPQSSLRPTNLPHPTGSTQFPRPANASIAGPVEALPPPPWAQSESATLAPLPETAAETPHRLRLIAAVLVALVAAVAGFFGVRIIADLATEGASSGSILAPQTAVSWSAPPGF